MIEPLDIRTMLQEGAVVCLLLAVVMIYYSIARKTYPGFHHWTMGIGSIGIGAVLVSMRGTIPDFFTMIVGNILIILMPFLLVSGGTIFFGVKWKSMPVCIGVLLLYTCAQIFFTYASPNLLARVICLSITMALLFGEALRILLKYTKSIFESHETIVVFFVSLAIFSSLFRIVAAVLSIESFGFIKHAGFLHSIAVLAIITSVVGIACSCLIFNAHRIEIDLMNAKRQIERIANLDGLTNLYNRRFFDQTLDNEFKRARRSAQAISLIIADIDCFKLYNDTYGHQAGDDCLKVIASILMESGERVSDTAARYGGEEFALLLPNTDTKGALNVANSLQEKIKAKAIPHKASHVCSSVTISIGIATITPNEAIQPTDLVKFADQALYASKNNGKNQIQLYGV